MSPDDLHQPNATEGDDEQPLTTWTGISHDPLMSKVQLYEYTFHL